MEIVREVTKQDCSRTNYSTGYYRIVRISPCQGKIQWSSFDEMWQDIALDVMTISECDRALNRMLGIWPGQGGK